MKISTLIILISFALIANLGIFAKLIIEYRKDLKKRNDR